MGSSSKLGTGSTVELHSVGLPWLALAVCPLELPDCWSKQQIDRKHLLSSTVGLSADMAANHRLKLQEAFLSRNTPMYQHNLLLGQRVSSMKPYLGPGQEGRAQEAYRLPAYQLPFSLTADSSVLLLCCTRHPQLMPRCAQVLTQ